MRPKKTEKRVQIINGIMDALTSKDVYGVINSSNAPETSITYILHPALIKHLTNIYKSVVGLREDLAEKHAKESLLWERNPNTTINHINFLGTQHRPDFVIQIEDIEIAIEVKVGESGQSIREGLGQSIVYASSKFDFVCYLFVDSSNDKKIISSLKKEPEKSFLAELWESYNIRFEVVG